MREYLITPNLEETLLIAFPNCKFKIDKELFLYDTFVPLLETGQKKTTVRYGSGKIRIPESGSLPLYESKAEDKNHKRFIGQLEISSLAIKSFEELTEKDGVNDGFSGKAELVNTIESIYGKIAPNDLVSIYRVKL